MSWKVVGLILDEVIGFFQLTSFQSHCGLGVI
jgi:hypothetical protein